jgi:hypothetical protein
MPPLMVAALSDPSDGNIIVCMTRYTVVYRAHLSFVIHSPVVDLTVAHEVFCVHA